MGGPKGEVQHASPGRPAEGVAELAPRKGGAEGQADLEFILSRRGRSGDQDGKPAENENPFLRAHRNPFMIGVSSSMKTVMQSACQSLPPGRFRASCPGRGTFVPLRAGSSQFGNGLLQPFLMSRTSSKAAFPFGVIRGHRSATGNILSDMKGGTDSVTSPTPPGQRFRRGWQRGEKALAAEEMPPLTRSARYRRRRG